MREREYTENMHIKLYSRHQRRWLLKFTWAILVPRSPHKMPGEATETVPATEQELPQPQAETGRFPLDALPLIKIVKLALKTYGGLNDI